MNVHNSNEMNEKLRKAKEWLGEKYVLHPKYKSRLRHCSTYEMLRPVNERKIPDESRTD